MDFKNDELSIARYRQLTILRDRKAVLLAEIENSILKNTRGYEQYDYNNRHRIMKNDIALALANNAEYQTIKRNIVQLLSEDNDLELYYLGGEL